MPVTGYDVFLSYAHRDSAWVRPIVDELRACGLSVWFDESDIPDFASITQSIEQGLSRAKVLLACYSRIYPQRRACQWELTAAFIAAKREGDPRRRVLVVNPEPGADHIHPVELRDAKFHAFGGGAEAVSRIAASVREHCARLDAPLGAISPLRQPQWYGMRGVGSTRFVGRLPDLWRIHSALHAGEVGVITNASGFNVAQIRGMGGVGKSLLAEEYALRFGAAFPGGVFWLHAYASEDSKTGIGPEEREAERERQLTHFAALLQLPVRDRTPGEIEGALAVELERRGQPCLWVVDDIPSGLDGRELRRWFAPHSLARTLFTTRTRDYGAQAEPIDLGVLDEEEALELLTSKRKPQGPIEMAAARGLVRDLGGHALALDVARAALSRFAGLKSFAKFRQELAQTNQDALELASVLADALPNGHQKSIAETLVRSIGQVGEPARDFLRLASVLAAAPIPALLVSQVFREVDQSTEMEAEALALVGLDEADSLSLTEETGEQEGARRVHPLIARAVRMQKTAGERIQALRAAAIRVLNRELPRVVDPRSHTEMQFEVAHARELAAAPSNTAEAELLGWVARYDLLRGGYKSAETLYRLQAQRREKLLGPEHPETIASLSNLAGALWAEGDLTAARELQERVWRSLERIFGPEHHQTLRAITNLAGTLSAQGELPAARELQEKALPVFQKALGPNHPDTLTAMNNLAETLRSQGGVAAARPLHEAVLEIRRRALGPDHPDTLASVHHLAKTLSAQGDLTGARRLHEQALEARRQVLGPEHPDSLTSMNNLANTLWLGGDMQGARKLYEQALQLLTRVLGPEHPKTLSSMSNLAGILGALGNWAEAQALEERALEISRRVLGPEHPATLSSMNSLATALWAQGDAHGARRLQQEALAARRRVLGHDHPHTLMSMNTLAGTLWALEEFEPARELQEGALAIARSRFGESHPETLRCMKNLAKTLDSLATRLEGDNDLAGVCALRGEVLELQSKRVGQRDPATLMAAWRYFQVLRRAGDVPTASAIGERYLQPLIDSDPAILPVSIREIRERFLYWDNAGAASQFS